MHTNCAPDRWLGFSLVELLTAIAVLAIVSTVTVARLKIRAELNQARCAHGLRETGLAFRLFANDNADQFPAQVGSVFGGAREAAAAGDAASIFRALGYYQLKPEHLVCSGDVRLPAVDISALTAGNLSYFLNLDAAQVAPAAVLLGDRDVTPAGAGRQEAGWITGERRLDQNGPAYEWSGALHRRGGNLAAADGSVKAVGTQGLDDALRPRTIASARLLFPQ